MACVAPGSKWLEWLKGQGLITEADEAYRVVIDISMDAPIKIYVSKYADDLKVVPPDVNDTSIEPVEVVQIGAE